LNPTGAQIASPLREQILPCLRKVVSHKNPRWLS
jgi:hypothetical protein